MSIETQIRLGLGIVIALFVAHVFWIDIPERQAIDKIEQLRVDSFWMQDRLNDIRALVVGTREQVDQKCVR